MSCAEFVQGALRNYVAPPGSGVNVGDRIRRASRELGWSYSRVRDAWYADPRISISAEEIRQIEEATGLRHAREELDTLENLINRADALLGDDDEDLVRPLLDALRAVARIVDRARAGDGS